MKLQKNWANHLFMRLSGVYGAEFTNKFKRIVNGQDVGLEAAIEVWSDELGFCAEQPELISWALKNLPEKAPNAIEFKRLCKSAPRAERQIQHDSNALGLTLTDEQIAENKEKIREITKKMKSRMMMQNAETR